MTTTKNAVFYWVIFWKLLFSDGGYPIIRPSGDWIIPWNTV